MNKETRFDYFRSLVDTNPALLKAVQPKVSKYCPQAPSVKQGVFLALRNVLEVLYGGAAAGGKSSALLMAALDYVDQPEYSALLLRRTFNQLDMSDSILDRARRWLAPWEKEVKWSEKKKTFEFLKSGAKLQFGYTQYDADVYQYDSAAYQFIGFDELVQFSEFQFTFLAGRLRKLKGSPIPLRLRGATNPGNIGHIWVKNRFIKKRVPDRMFVPARLEDNPYADHESYEKALAILDPVTRAQRRLGDWDVSAEGTKFKREWFTQFISYKPNVLEKVRYWDLAATLDGGDWLVGTLLSKDVKGMYFVEHVYRGQPGPAEVYSIIRSTAEVDGPTVPVRLEQEGGASGKMVIADIIKLLAGFDVKGEPSMTDKISRWQPFAVQCQNENVVLCSGAWNDDWLDEICGVPNTKHDDQADSVSGAFKFLAIDAPRDFGMMGVSRKR